MTDPYAYMRFPVISPHQVSHLSKSFFIIPLMLLQLATSIWPCLNAIVIHYNFWNTFDQLHYIFLDLFHILSIFQIHSISDILGDLKTVLLFIFFLLFFLKVINNNSTPGKKNLTMTPYFLV